MKKALQISIAHTLFTIEEDAYVRLEAYLVSVRTHFETTDGYGEIITDIESRIAEQLLEGGQRIVTLDSIEAILAKMGRVEDFDESTSAKERPKATEKASLFSKKLYRDPDGAVLGGVCSGLAAYIGIDKIWIRLAFVILTFFSGFGILLYTLLWLVTPVARTASQKLEMAGSPVTIESLIEALRQRRER